MKMAIYDKDKMRERTLTQQTENLFYMGAELEQEVDEKQDILTFDEEPIQGSRNPVTSNGIYNAVQHGVVVDRDLSNTSTNPVQNNTITNKIYGVEQRMQPRLRSGETIKTINGESILGSGDIQVAKRIIVDPAPVKNSPNAVSSGGVYVGLTQKQNKLVSGSNIKTINGEPVLGAGDIQLQEKLTFDSAPVRNSQNPVTSDGVYRANITKQDKLISSGERQNIKTINGAIITGRGNIQIDGTAHIGSTAPANPWVGQQWYEPTTNSFLICTHVYEDNTAEWVILLNGQTVEGVVWGSITGSIDNQADLVARLATKQDLLQFDDYPTAGSSNPVKSAGILEDLDTKQPVLVSGTNIITINGQSILRGADVQLQTVLTFDDVPTSGSDNPVKSTGIASAISEVEGELVGKQDILDAGTYIQLTPVVETGHVKIDCTLTPGTTEWGDIQGNISDQADLNQALEQKQEVLSSGTNIVSINGNSILVGENLELQPMLHFDTAPTDGSTNPVTSDGVYDALQQRSPVLDAGDNITLETQETGHIKISAQGGSFTPYLGIEPIVVNDTTHEISIKSDAAPVAGSTNMVTSGGVATALDNKQNKLTATTPIQISNDQIGMAQSGATPGTYGDSTHVSQVSVDAFGRITNVTNVPIQGGGGSYSAGNGIDITNNVISAEGGDGIIVRSSGITYDPNVIQEKMQGGNAIEIQGNSINALGGDGIQILQQGISAKLGYGLQFDAEGNIELSTSAGVNTINSVAPDASGDIELSAGLSTNSEPQLVIGDSATVDMWQPELHLVTPTDSRYTWEYLDPADNVWKPIPDPTDMTPYTGYQIGVNITFTRTYQRAPFVFCTPRDTTARSDPDAPFLRTVSQTDCHVACGDTEFQYLQVMVIPAP